jgi:raffinose/stachyose/melibiose transport system substrate-binding protein
LLKKYRDLFFALCAVSVFLITASCSQKKAGVYILNFKPEIDEAFWEVAAEFTKETGIPAKLVTAASGTYEQTLRSEINKLSPPTIFTINGPVGYRVWKDNTLDLSGTQVYEWLLDKNTAIQTKDGVFGIPWTIESYGIIYNDAILRKYFALANRANKDINDASGINNFEKLSRVVKDMQLHLEDLDIQGVFASTSFAPGEDWRWNTHLANLPVFYEYRNNNTDDMDTITLPYSGNFKNIFDLYLNNSISPRKLVGAMTVGDSMSEFALGKVAFVQNGTWSWEQIHNETGNVVKREDIKFLPVYTGMAGEEKQGLCNGTENFFAINSKASPEDQAASIKFLEWLFNTPQGRKAAYEKLQFVAPFSTFSEDEIPGDPLVQDMFRRMHSPLYSVSWVFLTFPSQEFKNVLGSALLDYSVGNKEWQDVEDTFIQTWDSEKKALNDQTLSG